MTDVDLSVDELAAKRLREAPLRKWLRERGVYAPADLGEITRLSDDHLDDHLDVAAVRVTRDPTVNREYRLPQLVRGVARRCRQVSTEDRHLERPPWPSGVYATIYLKLDGLPLHGAARFAVQHITSTTDTW